MRTVLFMILVFTPPILLVADVVAVFFKRNKSTALVPVPYLQLWIQDFFLLALGFVAAMAWGFDRIHWTTALFPVLSVAAGFVAAADVSSSRKTLSPLGRAALFAAIIAGFIAGLWIAASLWFFWKRFSARRAGRACVDKTARVFAAAATLIYGAAFFLPMSHHDEMGYDAYFLCCWYSNPRMEPGELPYLPLAWTANPCFWIATAFLLEGRRAMAAALALIAVALAWAISFPGEYTLLNSLAYAVWFASMVLLALLALIAATCHGKERRN